MSVLFKSTGNAQVFISGDRLNKRSLIKVNDLVRESLLALQDDYHVGVSFQLEAVRLTYYLPSLLKAPYPEIKYVDSLATKMAKIAEMHAKYPFVELELYHRKAGFKKDNSIAIVPLQNKGVLGYADLLKPYLTTGDVKLLGSDDEVIVELNPRGQSLTGDDWLQIECDYDWAVSGTKKEEAINLDKLAYDYLISQGFFAPTGIMTTNSFLDMIVRANADNTVIPRIFLTGTELTSMRALYPAKDKVQQINMNNTDLVPDIELEENLLVLTELTYFSCINTPRKGVDWVNVVNSLHKLVTLSVRFGELSSATCDAIAFAFDATGRMGGTLTLTNNDGYTAASQAARDNLISKGWDVN